jgi:AbrB family looped-hinge helix DNA binding protein
MSTSKITSKGQITLPKAVRDFLKLGIGDVVDFVIKENQEVLLRPKTMTLQNLKGSLSYCGKPISVENMNEVIRKRIQSKLKR